MNEMITIDRAQLKEMIKIEVRKEVKRQLNKKGMQNGGVVSPKSPAQLAQARKKEEFSEFQEQLDAYGIKL